MHRSHYTDHACPHITTPSMHRSHYTDHACPHITNTISAQITLHRSCLSSHNTFSAQSMLVLTLSVHKPWWSSHNKQCHASPATEYTSQHKQSCKCLHGDFEVHLHILSEFIQVWMLRSSTIKPVNSRMITNHDHISRNTGGKSTLLRHSLIKHSSARLCAADSVRISTMIAMMRAKNSESSAWFLANRCSRQSRSNIWHLSTALMSSRVQRSDTHTDTQTYIIQNEQNSPQYTYEAWWPVRHSNKQGGPKERTIFETM